MNSGLLCCYFFSGLIGFFVMFGGVHKIYEGHIGVYARGGALLPTYTEPGIHFMVPLITTYHSVQVTVQTDKVTNIPCGTSSGVMIYFDKIEVVNRLKKSLAFQTIKNYTINYDKTWIFDKIHHEINQFCSSHSLHEVYVSQFDELDDNLKEALQRGCNEWAPGIEIIAVRVTKPSIPIHILDGYEKMEREKTKLFIAKESQKVRAKEAETEKMLQKIRAETASAVAAVEMEESIIQREGHQKLEEIENQILYAQARTLAESENYKRLQEIEINQKKLTKEYMIYSATQMIKNANKHYFGESIPKYFETNVGILKAQDTIKAELKSSKDIEKPKNIETEVPNTIYRSEGSRAEKAIKEDAYSSKGRRDDL